MEDPQSSRSANATRVKGASLIARLEYLIEKGGSELRERVLERLSAEDRRVLENRPLPASLFPSRPDCESTAGYFERAIELAGGRQPKVELARCRHRGDDFCEFRCGWE
jgi:predicted hydrocarbon binding protein